MDRQKDRPVEAVPERPVEHGPDEIASVCARAFDLAMRIKRERFPGAGLCERTPGRPGHADGSRPRRIDTPAGTVSVQVPNTAGHDGDPFCPRSLERGRRQVARGDAGGGGDVHQGRVHPAGRGGDARVSAADVCVDAQIGWGMRFGSLPQRPEFEACWTGLKDRPAHRRIEAASEAVIPPDTPAGS